MLRRDFVKGLAVLPVVAAMPALGASEDWKVFEISDWSDWHFIVARSGQEAAKWYYTDLGGEPVPDDVNIREVPMDELIPVGIDGINEWIREKMTEAGDMSGYDFMCEIAKQESQRVSQPTWPNQGNYRITVEIQGNRAYFGFAPDDPYAGHHEANPYWFEKKTAAMWMDECKVRPTCFCTSVY